MSEHMRRRREADGPRRPLGGDERLVASVVDEFIEHHQTPQPSPALIEYRRLEKERELLKPLFGETMANRRVEQIKMLRGTGMDLEDAIDFCVNKGHEEIATAIKARRFPKADAADGRPSMDEYLVSILEALKTRAGCPRKQTAALVVDERHVLLSTGYNGPPSGVRNCTDQPCDGLEDGTGDMTRCEALHAEDNAIYFAADRIHRAAAIYCLNLPCFKCALAICRTPITEVVYVLDGSDKRCFGLFQQKGITIRRHRGR